MGQKKDKKRGQIELILILRPPRMWLYRKRGPGKGEKGTDLFFDW